jgi:hypothetical protein
MDNSVLKQSFLLCLALFAGLLTQSCNPTEPEAETAVPANPSKDSDRLLGAYYFGAGYFTLVPKNIRHDMDEMKGLGTDIVCIGITESDINYNEGNIRFIIEEAHQRDMQVFAVPSRMAGITAGQPIEPPLFGYHHPETAVLRKDGTPVVRKTHGILSSFYHPEVKNYFIETTSKMLEQFDLDGIIWDEPKSTWLEWQDFSELALKDNPEGDYVKYMEDFADFFSDINAELKARQPDLTIVHFDEACRDDTVVNVSATIRHLDYFGTDGKPYPLTKTENITNRDTKVLPKYGERYLKAGRENDLKTMMLVENQRMSKAEVDKMDVALPGILKMDADLLLYYYYGFYDEAPEYKMDVIRKHIPKFKNQNIQ